MQTKMSLATMIAVAAVISVPQLAFAQTPAPPSNTSPPGRVAPVNPAAPTRPQTAAPGASSTYLTADQQARASKLIGASVYNEQDQKIGNVDELLITNGHDVSHAVLSVGGFLGIKAKLVKVTYDQLQMKDNKLVMSGATKDQLMQLPEYKFMATNS
jgi:PRC-barrel domain